MPESFDQRVSGREVPVGSFEDARRDALGRLDDGACRSRSTVTRSGRGPQSGHEDSTVPGHLPRQGEYAFFSSNEVALMYDV